MFALLIAAALAQDLPAAQWSQLSGTWNATLTLTPLTTCPAEAAVKDIIFEDVALAANDGVFLVAAHTIQGDLAALSMSGTYSEGQKTPSVLKSGTMVEINNAVVMPKGAMEITAVTSAKISGRLMLTLTRERGAKSYACTALYRVEMARGG
jgi:hypothetical protein